MNPRPRPRILYCRIRKCQCFAPWYEVCARISPWILIRNAIPGMFVPPRKICVYLRVNCNFMTNPVSNFKVTDRQSFITFIDLLRKDFVDNHESWENKNLDDFLEALSSYANDIQGYYDNTKQNVNADEPNWQTFADIFKGATLYE